MHRICLIGFLLVLSVLPAAARDRYGIFTVEDFSPDVVAMKGKIEPTSGVDLRRMLRAHPEITTITLDSTGGHVLGALDVAYAVRDLRTVVPNEARCHGACAYIYFAGKTREAIGEIGVNQIKSSDAADTAKKVVDEMLAALREFGVPESVVIEMLRTPPNNLRLYSPQELAKLGLNSARPTEPAVAGTASALLLEASVDGTTGAVPTQGRIAWATKPDADGFLTLVARADFPDQGLILDLTIGRNSDESLPADAILEATFEPANDFRGKGVATLAGILSKDEELKQGTPLLGAAARIVGNHFLFAMSQSPHDTEFNRSLLLNSTFLDLAIVYETGRRAIVTLGLDAAALEMVNEVVGSWSRPPAAMPVSPRKSSSKTSN